jgi:molybdopterin/thiamine biosynthesis adenylyltransferase/rhodanese-related sulfurtransferase
MDAVDPRYSRQVALAGWGLEGQQKLADARVLVIGAGGLGSATIPALAAAGVGSIGIIDDDLVETSNLHRQLLHSPADVGHSKVASAAESVATLNPATRVIAMNMRLTAHNALSLFAAYDVVLDGCDNFPTRYLCNDAASLADVPLVWGSVSQYGGQAGLSWASRGPTYRDLFPVPPAAGSVLSCEFGGVLPTIVATLGSLMATETIKVITGIGTPALGRVTVVDALSGSFRTLEYMRDPTAPPVRELIDYELFCGLAPHGNSVLPRELAARTDDYTLLDVREPWEAEIATLPGAVLVPLGQLAARVGALDPDKPVIVYCHHGIRSETARGLLAERGFDVANLTGGIDAWAREIDPAMARY